MGERVKISSRRIRHGAPRDEISVMREKILFLRNILSGSHDRVLPRHNKNSSLPFLSEAVCADAILGETWAADGR